MTLEIKSGKEVDPMEDGMFPLCYVGYDAFTEMDYWLVTDDENASVRENAEFLFSLVKENENLKKQLAEEKARTNMLNFGQVGR